MKGAIEKCFKDVKLFPYWLDNPLAPQVERELIGQTTADLVIVGGGFTGLWAAVQAKELMPHLDVVVIEAGKVAYGASGRAGGIISTSVMHGLPNATRVFPKDLDILEQFGHDNLDGFKATVARYGIDADLEWNGEMTVAVDDAHLEHLEQDFMLHKQHGHNVVLLNREEAQAQLGSPLYAGAMWSRDRSGIVHPAKMAWGLKAAALKLGVRLYEMSPLTKFEDCGATMLVHTQAGRIRTPRVLLGTGTAHVGIKDIGRRVMQVRDHVLATQPLSKEQLDRIGWKNRQGVYDTRTQLNYYRLTKDNRIIFGGLVSYHFNGNNNPAQDREESTYHPLGKVFYQTFPQLHDVHFSHAWGGPIDYCSRGAVFARRYFNEKVVYVAGYTGFGVAGSRFGALMGLNILFDRKTPERSLDISTQGPSWIPPEPFRWAGAKITFHAFDGADSEGGWKRMWINGIKKLGFPM
ncbi:FAD-dependent oxidoreductase [Pseudoduganella ginsengisoli]|uniref:FAD-dependent oxidoreductase n=1 Tax=Pseudoduganella ginsengisoli TaxID=1462440 RepID=A0A6L6Q071_9BURK|nr:FAD-dependent oxidoreductase [Pseudoduganella ginsengisoli]MTW03030.1 FAD-dependent oxidoreductase [Pseudoduganella ginsengisoli]